MWVDVRALRRGSRGTAALGLVLCFAAAGCAVRSARHPAKPIRARQLEQRQVIEGLLQAAARRHGVDPALVRGVIQIESSFRVDARSSVGARGLMQLMPGTAADLAQRLKWGPYEIEDPHFNIEAGTSYLAYLLRRFDGSKPLALAAYHTGPSRVGRWVRAGRPLPSYSRRYVRDVMAAADRLRHGPPAVLESSEPDREALRALLRVKLYGPREPG